MLCVLLLWWWFMSVLISGNKPICICLLYHTSFFWVYLWTVHDADMYTYKPSTYKTWVRVRFFSYAYGRFTIRTYTCRPFAILYKTHPYICRSNAARGTLWYEHCITLHSKTLGRSERVRGFFGCLSHDVPFGRHYVAISVSFQKIVMIASVTLRN